MDSGRAATMMDAILRHCAREPGKAALNWLDDRCEVQRSLTYGELERNTRDIAARLQALSAREGLKGRARALLCYPPGLAFMEAFLACLRAGVIAVPVSLPYAHQVSYITDTLLHIAEDCGASFVLTSHAYLEKPDEGLIETIEIPWFSTTSLGAAPNEQELPEKSPSFDAKRDLDKVTTDEVSFLQYTSGSTGHPKGVMITHGNLVHNLSLMEVDMHTHSSMVEITFLPHYHDMGLIMSYLLTLFSGGTSYAMSPFMFVENPGLWLRAFSKFRGTHAKAPNFAFDLVLRKGFPSDINLASVEYILNAAEPVFAETLERFHKVLAPYGLKKNVVSPGYGLAEHTVYVCTTYQEDPLVINNRISCGKPPHDFTMKIVNPDTKEPLPDRKEGEVWISSASKALGYWQNSEATHNSLIAKLKNDTSGTPYLRTGDLGFVSSGNLFCSGRVKDLIIYHGRKIHPSDIEIRIESSFSAVRPGRTVAMEYSYSFRSNKETLHSIGVAYVAEISKPTKHTQLELQSLAEQIAARISRYFLVEVPLVVFINPYTIPRTTSGKRQRTLCKKRLDKGSLVEISRWSPHEDLRMRSTLTQLPGRTATLGGRAAWKTLKEKTFNRRMSLPPNLSSKQLSLSRKKRRSYESLRRWSRPSVTSITSRQNSIDRLTDTISSVIGVPLDQDSNIWAYGCNSLKVVELSKRLKFEFGFTVEPHLFFTHQTPSALMGRLQLTLLNESKASEPGDDTEGPWGDGSPPDEEEEEEEEEGSPELKCRHSADDIAVVAMACSVNGCDSVDSLWRRLCAGDISFTTVRSPATGKDIHAGFTSAVGAFDYKWFGMSEWEASTLDPQQALLLHTAWECLHNAGYHPGESKPDDKEADFGVFVAMSAGDAQIMARSKPPFPPATSFHTSIAANRIARSFNLTGPSMTIDTACASSLTALDVACTFLKASKCDRALVGGVNALLDPHFFTILANMGMTSPTGRCSVFDERANGYVRGEGCSMVLLMPLAAAQKEGKRILAVVKSTCSADNGKSSPTLTAPNSATQSKLIKKALAIAKIEPEKISFVEAHGTGTKLGDPIEVDALDEVFGLSSVARNRETCNAFPPVVGSLKADIGHLEAGAGIAGLIKSVLILDNATAPGNRALKTVNSAFARREDGFDADIFPTCGHTKQLCPEKLEGGSPHPPPLLAGVVSSFGFGGSVATAVIQQYQPLPHLARVECGILLDAKHKEELTTAAIKEITSIFKGFLPAFSKADERLDESIRTCIHLGDRNKTALRDGTDYDMALFRLFFGLVSVLQSLELEITSVVGNDLASVTVTQVVKGEIDLTGAICSLVNQDKMDTAAIAEMAELCREKPLVLQISLVGSSVKPPQSLLHFKAVTTHSEAATSSKESDHPAGNLMHSLRSTLVKLREYSDTLELQACSNKPSKNVRMPGFYQSYPLRRLVDSSLAGKEAEEGSTMVDQLEKEVEQLLKTESMTAEVADLAHSEDKQTCCKFGAYGSEVVPDESGYVTQAGSAESLAVSSRQSTPIKPHPSTTPSLIPPSRGGTLTSKASHKETILSTLYEQIKEDLDSSDVTVEEFASSGLFELGLDSLNVMQIADFIDQKYRVSKPFSEIIDYETVGELAEAIANESSVLALPQQLPASIATMTFPKVGVREVPPDYPKLTKPGYFTEPEMSRITTMTKEELKSVQDFTVGRQGAGKLVFLGATDVTGLDIDKLLCIEKECVEIVRQADSNVSDRLNKPALLYFEDVFPSDYSPEGLEAFVASLKGFCQSSALPMLFSSYDVATGVLKIEVDKFY